MPSRPIRFSLRGCLSAGAALCALTAGAAAKDLPATPEGAQKLNVFLSTYLGAPPADAPPAFKVTPEESDYLVTLDIAALAAPLKAAGFAYDPAILKYKLTEQDDGAWRIEGVEMPPVSGHTPHGASTVSMSGYKSEIIIDPTTAWVRSVSGAADKITLHNHIDSGVDETVTTGALQFSGSGNATSGGAVSSAMRESLADIGVSVEAKSKVDGDGGDPKTTDVGAHVGQATVDGKLEGLKPHAALDLWAFLVAHPSRADLAANEAALKGLIGAFAANPIKLNEALDLQKIGVQIKQGSIAMEAAKIGVGADTAAPGAFEERIAFDGLTLPAGLVPALYRDFTPTSADIGFKASGFDMPAATAEAIADLHLAGEGPPLSPEDRAKVWAKLLGPGSVTIDVPLSHLVAPRLDISIQGQVHYKNGRPSGSMTVHMRNFDNTLAALKGLGPDTERKLVPAMALAKGLAQTDGDGVLTWVGELGPDGSMKVNGLPLGKAPL